MRQGRDRAVSEQRRRGIQGDSSLPACPAPSPCPLPPSPPAPFPLLKAFLAAFLEENAMPQRESVQNPGSSRSWCMDFGRHAEELPKPPPKSAPPHNVNKWNHHHHLIRDQSTILHGEKAAFSSQQERAVSWHCLSCKKGSEMIVGRINGMKILHALQQRAQKSSQIWWQAACAMRLFG